MPRMTDTEPADADEPWEPEEEPEADVEDDDYYGDLRYERNHR